MGDNVESYAVIRDILSVKNKIIVFGATNKPLPQDKDARTDSLTNWSASEGEVLLNDVAHKVGTYTIRGYTGGTGNAVTFRRTFDPLTLRTLHTIYLWGTASALASSGEVRLLAPDSSYYFYKDLGDPDANWHFDSCLSAQNAMRLLIQMAPSRKLALRTGESCRE